MPGGRGLDYADYVGLILNEDRERLRRAVEVARGLGLAHSREDPGREWADALAVDAAEVDELHFQMMKAASQSRAGARGNRGPAGDWMG